MSRRSSTMPRSRTRAVRPGRRSTGALEPREPAPRREGRRVADRAPGVARANPGGRRQRAAADRARPPRRRAAAARRMRIKLGLAGDVMREDPARGASMVAELGDEAEARSRRCARSRRACTRPSSPTRGSAEALQALGRRSTPIAARHDQRRRPIPAGDRERRLLLLPRGAPERREARADARRSRSRSTSTTRSSSRSATTAPGSPATRSGPGSASRACTTGSPRSADG